MDVVIDHANVLHERVHARRSHEAVPLRLQLLGERVRLRCRRGELCDGPRRTQSCALVAPRERREARRGGPDRACVVDGGHVHGGEVHVDRLRRAGERRDDRHRQRVVPQGRLRHVGGDDDVAGRGCPGAPQRRGVGAVETVPEGAAGSADRVADDVRRLAEPPWSSPQSSSRSRRVVAAAAGGAGRRGLQGDGSGCAGRDGYRSGRERARPAAGTESVSVKAEPANGWRPCWRRTR